MPPRALCVAAISSLFLAACISSSPPAAAVRFFDCAARCEQLQATAPVALPQPLVVSGTGLGTEFAVRVGAHELSFDNDHRWLMPPEQLVAAALWRALYVDGPFTVGSGPGVIVTLQQFEFDLTTATAPAAVVELAAAIGGKQQVFQQRVAASGTEASVLAAAMVTAVTQAVTALRAALLP